MTSQYVPLSAAEAAKHRTRVTLLGTAGGPPWWDGSDRSGISTAITVNGSVYIIDCGEGWGPSSASPASAPRASRRAWTTCGPSSLPTTTRTTWWTIRICCYWPGTTGPTGCSNPSRSWARGTGASCRRSSPRRSANTCPRYSTRHHPTPGLVESTERLLHTDVEGYEPEPLARADSDLLAVGPTTRGVVRAAHEVDRTNAVRGRARSDRAFDRGPGQLTDPHLSRLSERQVGAGLQPASRSAGACSVAAPPSVIACAGRMIESVGISNGFPLGWPPKK